MAHLSLRAASYNTQDLLASLLRRVQALERKGNCGRRSTGVRRKDVPLLVRVRMFYDIHIYTVSLSETILFAERNSESIQNAPS